MQAFARSFTCKNSRLGLPVPQIITFCDLFFFAVSNFLIKAGITWLFFFS